MIDLHQRNVLVNGVVFLAVPFSVQVYKWVPTNLIMPGLSWNGLASQPEGSKNIASRFMQQKVDENAA